MRTTASEALIFVHVRRFDTQNLVKLGRRRGVLQEHTLFREDVVASGKGSERTFMEARQDELLLARIGIDVANSEDTRDVRFKASRVDNDLLTFQGEAPVFDRAKLGLQAKEDQEVVKRNTTRYAVGTSDEYFGELVIGFVKALPTKLSVQSSAESPPPQITTFLPSKMDGSLQL